MNKAALIRLLGDEKGQAIVLFALLLMVLLGTTAFTVDVGYLQWQKRHLQNAADAAALAGARALIDGQAVYAEVTRYVEAHGFDENDIDNKHEIQNLSAGDTEIPVALKITRDLYFARVLGFEDSDVAVFAAAEVVSSLGSNIPNHAIISFDEHGRVRFSGAGNRPKIDSDPPGPISVFANNNIEVNGNQRTPINTEPVAYYCGSLTGSGHHASLFTGGIINPPQKLVSPFADLIRDSGDNFVIRSQNDLAGIFSEADVDVFDYYDVDEDRNILGRHNQHLNLPFGGPGKRVVYIRGDIDRNRNISIETNGGLVIIEGDLVIRGNSGLFVDSIVYTTGNITLGGNAGSINGGLWSEKDVWLHGTPNSFFYNPLDPSLTPGQVTYAVMLKR